MMMTGYKFRGSATLYKKLESAIRKLKHAVKAVSPLRGSVSLGSPRLTLGTRRSALPSWPRVLCTCLSALGTLLLSSCVTEVIDTYEPPTTNRPSSSGEFTEIEIPGYIGFELNIKDTTSTRADGEEGKKDPANGDSFQDGDDAEYQLATDPDHHFIIFCDNNTIKAIVPLSLTNKGLFTEGHETINGKTKYDNITLTATSIIVSSQLSNNSFNSPQDFSNFLNNNLTGCIPYTLINFDRSAVSGITASDFVSNKVYLENLTATTLQALPLKDYKFIQKNTEGKDVNYFLMSISRIGGAYNEWAWGTKSSNSNLVSLGSYNFNNVDADITKVQNSPVCTIYVERVAAKFSVDFSKLSTRVGSDEEDSNGMKVLFSYTPSTTLEVFNNSGEDKGLQIDTTSYKIVSTSKNWEIEVLGYGMNALESSSFYLKKLNSDIVYFTNWQDKENFRTYWSEDPHYLVSGNTTKYPLQFRQALEVTGSRLNVKHSRGSKANNKYPGYNDDGSIKIGNVNESCLTYYPFISFGNKTGDPYTFENSYNDRNGELGERGYYSAGTHLILIARIKINDVVSNDLYMDQNNIFYKSKEEILEAKLNIMEKVVLNQGNNAYRVLDTDWINHEPDLDNYTEAINWNEKSYIWMSNTPNGPWTKITYDHLDLIEAELSGGDGQRLIAPKNTSAYYTLAPEMESGVIDISKKEDISSNHIISLFHKVIGPIDHFNNGYMYYPAAIPHRNNKELTNDSYKTVGDYGVVRNNWYEIQVTAINGVGRPVDNIKQPIIPNLDIKRDYLNMTVNILEWHRTEQNIHHSTLETAPEEKEDDED